MIFAFLVVKPRVEIIYASGSLKPWFDFKFESKVDIRQLRKENLTHTNVIKSVENATKFCDYARLLGAVHAETDLPFEPVGELVGEFPAPRTAEELIEGTGNEACGGRLVLHHFIANTADSVRLALRLQTLVIWLIECGGCIEVIEPWMLREGGEGWEILIALVRFRIVYFRAMSALFHTNIDSFWSLLFQAGSGNQPTRKMNVKNHDRWISRDIVFSDIFGKC
mmetsp:Transcript_86323/g.230523  ORF Transcript_86323/g.230523 Transcript_86323/m.230523 type:complete len:224 (+) Transcript_86323:740-1411(+)